LHHSKHNSNSEWKDKIFFFANFEIMLHLSTRKVAFCDAAPVPGISAHGELFMHVHSEDRRNNKTRYSGIF